MICSKCGADVPEGRKFCIKCGAASSGKIELSETAQGNNSCPNCGAPILAGRAFCGSCGNRVIPDIDVSIPSGSSGKVASSASSQQQFHGSTEKEELKDAATIRVPNSVYNSETTQTTNDILSIPNRSENVENRPGIPIWVWASIAFAVLAAVGGWFILHRPKQETPPHVAQHGSLSVSSQTVSDSSTMSSLSDTTGNAKDYVFTKHWAIGNLPCNYLGGAYTFFDDQHGNVLVTQGKVQLPGAPTKVAYSEVSSSGFTLTMTTYANDLVAKLLNDPNAISGTQIEQVTLLSPDKISVHLTTKILDINSLLNHVKNYETKDETNIWTACPNDTQQNASAIANAPTNASSPSTTASPETPADLTTTSLANLSYQVGGALSYLGQSGSTVKLTDGSGSFGDWQAFLDKGSTAYGDLDGDGVPDAVVVLHFEGPGSAAPMVLAAITNHSGIAKNVAVRSLGDNATVKNINIQDGVVTVNLLTVGPNDSMANPETPQVLKLKVNGNKFLPADKRLTAAGDAEFISPHIATHNIQIAPGAGFAFYPTFGGNWRITAPGGGFRATFDAPQDGKYDLAVTHLTSAAPTCPGNGFSPITIALNSQNIVKNYDPAQSHNGSHDFVTDHWTLNLHEGQNLLAWTAGNLCTHYWIQRIEIRNDLAATGSGI
jgi:uncharacterized OB-fold protein